MKIWAIISSICGGFFYPTKQRGHLIGLIVRAIFLIINYVFFCVMFYMEFGEKANLIACAVLIFLTFIVKLSLYLLNLLAQAAVNISDSGTNVNINRPKDITPEMWSLRSLLQNPKQNLDSIVSDLIASGVDAEGLIKLVEFLNSNKQDAFEELSIVGEELPVINICGNIVELPFNKKSIGHIFPSDFSFPVLIFTLVFGFSGAYLPLSLAYKFSKAERWWIALICAISTSSLLTPPSIEPYMTFFPDSWTGIARPFAITIISTFWRVVIRLSEDQPSFHLPFYEHEFRWNLIVPLTEDVCYGAFLLLPLWVFAGYVGHPLTSMVSIIEGFNRYAFGQNGVSGIPHMIFQFLRGTASVACCWGLLQHQVDGLNISFAIAIATFLATFPFFSSPKNMKAPVLIFSYSLILTASSFIVSYCFVGLVGNNWKACSWFSFAWFLLIDIIYPYLYSLNRYFILYYKMIPTNKYSSLCKNISQIIVGPLFVASCLHESQLNPLLLAFIIVHSVQKYNSEPHYFGFACILTVATLPSDFNLNNRSANLLIALLLSAKLEVSLPMIELFFNSRDFFEYDDNFEYFARYHIMPFFIPIYYLISRAPFVDYILKIPSLLWGILTGSSFSSIIGNPYLLTPGSPKPYYFFDWPLNQGETIEDLFNKNLSDHPLEVSVYASLCKEVQKEFGTIVKSGILGNVNAGNIYLLYSDSSIAYIHVIAIEPSKVWFQLRGLEKSSVTACHNFEVGQINDIIDNLDSFGHMQSAMFSAMKIMELRAYEVPFYMYSNSEIDLNQAFLALEFIDIKKWFFFGFSYVIATNNNNLVEYYNFMDNRNEPPNFSVDDSQIISIFAESANTRITGDDLNKIMSIWNEISSMIFEVNMPNFSIIFHFFSGKLSSSENFAWINNSQILINDIIQPAIQLGCILTFIASAGVEIDSSAPLPDIFSYIHNFVSNNTISTFDSDLFHKALFEKKSNQIFTLNRINHQIKIIRFSLNPTRWSFFKMNHEWIRALWAGEERQVIYFQQSYAERSSIQSNIHFFNNLIIQAADIPIGYPAYISSIMDSYTNPFSTKQFHEGYLQIGLH